MLQGLLVMQVVVVQAPLQAPLQALLQVQLQVGALEPASLQE